MRRWPFLDHDLPLAFAHRGGAGDWPENTMPAFEHALSLGYGYLETDVHATADGVLVAFHDESLDRVTDRRGLIRSLPWSVVRSARVGGVEPIVLLEDLLGAFPGRRFNIDAKHDTCVAPLVDVLFRSASIDRVCVASFSVPRLREARRLVGPRLCTSMGRREVAGLRAASMVRRGIKTAAACVQVPVSFGGVRIVDARFLAAAHAVGLPVHVWTVDDPTEMHALLDLGVDGIMTDRPAVLREVLIARGDW